jgi:amino-acid N-acetyltransferase
MNDLTYRRAKPSDARAILGIINGYSAKGLMLPRSFSQVVERIRDFTVAANDGGVQGVVALHVVGEEMAEVRSLAVLESQAGVGWDVVSWRPVSRMPRTSGFPGSSP